MSIVNNQFIEAQLNGKLDITKRKPRAGRLHHSLFARAESSGAARFRTPRMFHTSTSPYGISRLGG